MAGDDQAGDRAIEAARLAGVPNAELAFLEGQLAYFTGGDPVTALENAVKLDDTSVAAHALLAMAYTAEGLQEESLRSFMRARELTPKNPTDHLFRAFALSAASPSESMEDLQRAIEERGSPVAFAVRTVIKITLARNARDADLANEVVQNGKDIAFLLGRNQTDKLASACSP